jgi:hypothetical protein
MSVDGANLVAGLFSSKARADEALRDLHRIGLSDADVEIGAPEPGQYRIEYHEFQELGRGACVGMLIGIPVGGVIATALLMMTVPMSVAAAIGLGGLIGGFWGLFFGGLGGTVVKVLAQEHGAPRCAIVPGSADVLVVAHAGPQIGVVHEVIGSHRPRYFLTDVPAVQHRRAPLAVTG